MSSVTNNGPAGTAKGTGYPAALSPSLRLRLPFLPVQRDQTTQLPCSGDHIHSPPPDTDVGAGATAARSLSAGDANQSPPPANASETVTRIKNLLQNLPNEVEVLTCITQDVVAEPQARCSCSTPQTWEHDLQLMHHFSTSAYLTLIDHSSLHQFWQVTVPAIAFSFDFLLHGILAFSALHLAHLRPNETEAWTILSERHQSVAVTSFSSRLTDITNENVVPCLLYSCFVFMLETYSITTSSTAVLPRDISRSFILLQGVKGILLTEPGRWSSDGVLAPLMRRAVEPVFIPSKGFKAQIEALREIALPSEVTLICRNALDGLLTTFEAIAAPRSSYAHVWLWAFTLPQAFLEFVSEHEPFALVLLAHYATLVRCFEHDHWYIQGWSARVLVAVQGALLESWKPWLEWPVQCIQRGLDSVITGPDWNNSTRE
ncbi:hypothetical protein AU210_015961 [Fusarium oxysporum f. sp. radicis-cucumerinum]|uniref:Sterol uptake control protein 2 n=1 Tax=Fusarium oxysporum f. sp. radicis-cucumerinum TaxID=327505 RepID=A0A2H3GD67_FUSOX|nr:hypothetical protein AU210_015961 [Fusarium oxysporum f. sp. radicis-cucumerinum]